MTIAHTGIKAPAAKHSAVVAWYEAALAPLGYTRAIAFQDDLVVGFADASGAVDWWVTSSAAVSFGVPATEGAGVDGEGVLPTHTAFAAKGGCSFSLFPPPAISLFFPILLQGISLASCDG